MNCILNLCVSVCIFIIPRIVNPAFNIFILSFFLILLLPLQNFKILLTSASLYFQESYCIRKHTALRFCSHNCYKHCRENKKHKYNCTFSIYGKRTEIGWPNVCKERDPQSHKKFIVFFQLLACFHYNHIHKF